ncbi:helix-turn-helix domain-containing protein [Marinifilum sp. N1E240]|nr:helix-turn-helix transcriptional regulator [Marinifilum sp. N1E240]MPQ47738.1 helix-turn-helix domain-containing protein [Marinifilum sp. N1E240]
METGKLIKELRIKKGLTQEELAGRTEISSRTI